MATAAPHTSTPWDWTGTPQFEGGAFHCYIVDATGRKIGTVWGPADEKIARARLWSCAPDLIDALEPLAAIPLGPEIIEDLDLVLYKNMGRTITVGDVLAARAALDMVRDEPALAA